MRKLNIIKILIVLLFISIFQSLYPHSTHNEARNNGNNEVQQNNGSQSDSGVVIIEPEKKKKKTNKTNEKIIKIFSPVIHIAAIFGFFLLSFTIFVGSSSRFFDKKGIFGLAAILRYHKYLAIFSFSVILLHPISLIVVYGLRGQNIVKYVIPDFNSVYVSLGVTALYIFAIVIATTVFLFKALNHNIWINIHRLSIIAIIIAAFHAFKLAYWVNEYLIFKIMIITGLVLSTAGVIIRIIFLIIKPKIISEIIDVIKETDDTTTIKVKKPDNFKYKAGQFAFISFFKKGLKKPHPFTISSVPEMNYISFTIKSSGKFTSKISELNKGEKIKIDGPYGIFTFNNNNALFIAGGVGITPFKSMIEDNVSKSSLKLTLIYGSQYYKDIIFKKRLDEIEKTGILNIEYVLSKEEHEKCEKGFISHEIIDKHDDENHDYYICGPPLMLKSIKRILRKKHISSKRIFYEKFFW